MIHIHILTTYSWQQWYYTTTKVFIRNAYDYNFDEVNADAMMLMKKMKIMTFDM